MTTILAGAEIRRATATILGTPEELAQYRRDEFPHETLAWVLRTPESYEERPHRPRGRRSERTRGFWQRVASAVGAK